MRGIGGGFVLSFSGRWLLCSTWHSSNNVGCGLLIVVRYSCGPIFQIYSLSVSFRYSEVATVVLPRRQSWITAWSGGRM